MKCERCEEIKSDWHFIYDSLHPRACRECLTDEELHEYIRPDLSKAMNGLKIRQKQKVIKGLVKDYKKKQREYGEEEKK